MPNDKTMREKAENWESLCRQRALYQGYQADDEQKAVCFRVREALNLAYWLCHGDDDDDEDDGDVPGEEEVKQAQADLAKLREDAEKWRAQEKMGACLLQHEDGSLYICEYSHRKDDDDGKDDLG